METTLAVVTLVVAVAAGARSTWSPCGRSMLSTITPMGERGRGHRFGATAAWFVAGAVLGGLCLGAVTAGLAVAVGAAHLGVAVTGGLAAGAALVAAASDIRLGGLSLPIHRRQVNERWLDGYRPWVYGMGFGWQIGNGLATYIMTAGVYLVVVLGALSGRPAVALAAGGAFGLVRGLAVLLGRRLDTLDRLTAFHRRFDGLDATAKVLVAGIEALLAVVLCSIVSLSFAGVVGLVVLVGGAITTAVATRPVGTGSRAAVRGAGAGEEITRPVEKNFL